jgi:tellurite resistance protein TerC
LKRLKKIIVSIIGTTILLLGLVLIVLPGPAIIIIPLGLGILALEFDWAKNLLAKIKKKKNDKSHNQKQIT